MQTRRPHATAVAPALLVALLLLASLACDGPGEPRPNVLLIVLDTTRADALSCYGNPAPTTPHLDRLAAEGARFAQAFATDFWTLPSHASLLTGLYPSRHGATAETNHLPDGVVSMAEVLREAGYRTGAFVSNPWIGRERGFARGFELFVESWRSAAPHASGDSPTANDHAHDAHGIAAATDWMAARGAEEAPFFAFLNLNRPHLPYAPDPVTRRRIHPGPREEQRLRELARVAGGWKYLAGRIRLEPDDFALLRELYDAEVAITDALVGGLIERLREDGLLDRTLVVVTSDHGENIGEHGRMDHVLSMYETTVRVPLILRYPPRIGPGRVDEGIVSLVDVMPSVLDAAGLAGPDDRARSLLPPDRRPPEFVVAENERPVNGVRLLRREFPDFDADSIDERMAMIRTARHKLVWREKNGVELYDLRDDPEEMHDLSHREPALRDALLGRLRGWKQDHGTGEAPIPFESLDEESRARLRALGYAQ